MPTLLRHTSAILLLALAALACRGGSSTKESVSSAAKASASAVAVPNDACAQLQTKLCAESGEQSSTCAAAQLLLPLMSPRSCAVELEDVERTLRNIQQQGHDCQILVNKLCAQLQPETCAMVKDTTKQFPPGQCSQMLKDYDKVLAELKAEDAKHLPVTGDLLRRLHEDSAPSFGPKDARVTLVEFSDFQCPYCAKAAEVTAEVRKKYPGVRFVFRQYPLAFHTEAHKAHELGLAAAAAGKFWAYHDKVFENQNALLPDDLRKYAREVGLESKAIESALGSQQYSALVDGDIALGDAVGVSGTPSLFINGKRVTNASDFALVSKMIEEALVP